MRPLQPPREWCAGFDTNLWARCYVWCDPSGHLCVGWSNIKSDAGVITRWLWGLGLSPMAAASHLVDKAGLLAWNGNVGEQPDAAEQRRRISSFASHLARMEGTGLLIGAIEEARSHSVGKVCGVVE